MIKTIAVSSNRKTGPIAVTYRSGEHETYGTCPKSCSLHPKSSTGTDRIDVEYLLAVSDAVPKRGIAWTYSHFPAAVLPLPAKGKTVFNVSCDSVKEALEAVALGRPAVLTAPANTPLPFQEARTRFVACPAQLSEGFTCQQCGGGVPLCARGDRDYVIVFLAHGTGAKKVGTGEGGCYAASGPTAIQWHGTKTKGRPDDAKVLREFAASLPVGSLLRHHVAGDVGKEL